MSSDAAVGAGFWVRSEGFVGMLRRLLSMPTCGPLTSRIRMEIHVRGEIGLDISNNAKLIGTKVLIVLQLMIHSAVAV